MATKHYSDGRIEELDADGKVIWEWPKDRAKPNPAQALGPEPEPVKAAPKKATKVKGKK